VPVYLAGYVLPFSRLLSASPLSCLPGESSQVSQSYMSRRLQGSLGIPFNSLMLLQLNLVSVDGALLVLFMLLLLLLQNT